MTDNASAPSAEEVEALAKTLEAIPGTLFWRSAATTLRAQQSALAAAQAASVAGVMAEREACAAEIDCGCAARVDVLANIAAGRRASRNCPYGNCSVEMAARIRARPDPDPSADLARMLAEARAEGKREGLQEAIGIARLADPGNMTVTPSDPGATVREVHQATRAATVRALDAAIRALAPPATGTAETGGAAHAR